MDLRLSHCFCTVAAAVPLLGGCDSSLALLPPGIPAGSQLQSYAQNDFAPAYRMGVTPRDTLIIGVAYVDQRCAEFFDAVEQTARRTEVLGSGFVTAGNQTLALMAAAKRSALRIAQVAAAVEVTKVLLDEYKEQFTFAPHSAELRSIVLQAMTAQRKELGSLLGTQFSEVDAIAAVKKYAENCTLATIREHWNSALAKAVREGVQPDVPNGAAAMVFRSQRNGSRDAITPAPANVLGVNRYVVR